MAAKRHVSVEKSAQCAKKNIRKRTRMSMNIQKYADRKKRPAQKKATVETLTAKTVVHW